MVGIASRTIVEVLSTELKSLRWNYNQLKEDYDVLCDDYEDLIDKNCDQRVTIDNLEFDIKNLEVEVKELKGILHQIVTFPTKPTAMFIPEYMPFMSPEAPF